MINEQTPKQGNLRNLKMKSSKASPSKSDDTDFKVVTYSRKTRSHTVRTTPTYAEGKATGTTTNDNLKVASTHLFQEFQSKIFPIIKQIITNAENQDHLFVKKWIQANKGTTKIHSTSPSHRVIKALGLNNIQDYGKYLMTAPNIDKFVTL
jgi:hypothetical protein